MYRLVSVRVVVLLIVLTGLMAACSSSKSPTATAPPPTEDPMAMMPKAEGAAVVDYVLKTSPYTAWGTWPADQWNKFDTFLKSGEPHGSVVRIFVNDVALDAAAAAGFDGTLPPGSIVLKENYMGTDPAEPGQLAALTIMYKVEGFNPDANDWFWVKAAGDGSAVDAEGAVAGCIGCHSQPNNHDYLLRYGFGEEPAVPALGQAPADTVAGTAP